ncbi:LpxL/LpxP family acyltransferase [Chitinibacteraceae bacterium HSL-7]
MTFADLSWSARLLALPFWLLHWLPLSWLQALGCVLGELAYRVAPRRTHIGLTNLRLCFPEWEEVARHRVLRRHYRMLAGNLLAYGVLWFGSEARLRRLVIRRHAEHIESVAERTVIVLAPHFLGLDWGGIRQSMESRGASMYSSTHDRAFDQLLRYGRSRFNDPILIARREGIRAIVKAIQPGTMFYYLPDQDLGPSESIFAPFFGVQTATTPALGKLARLRSAAVLPMISTVEKGRFVVEYLPVWENFPSGDEQADTARMNALIEEYVRRDPAQYYWLHRRFKTRPAGEAGFY